MKGLEISKRYYEEFGRGMLKDLFPTLIGSLAIGSVGKGSERFGFDDEISKDHDFEPGFCIFLPDEDTVSRKEEFLLSRAYSKLPKSYLGIERQPMSPVGGNRYGVIRTSDFYLETTGTPDGRLSVPAWLTIPLPALAEAVNGEVFFDGPGEFSEIRERLLKMPDDVKKKRIAGNLLIMAQSGQYNFLRCLSHGETEASQLACFEFANAAMKVLFLANGQYMPFYKWSFRALREKVGAVKEADLLSSIVLGGVGDSEKAEKIDEICSVTSSLITKLGLSETASDDLEKLAYTVNNEIRDAKIRNLHILAAI